jgi:hypothetical protein
MQLPNSLSTALLTLALLPPFSSAAAEESWYRLDADGKAAGWTVERRWPDADRVISESEMSLNLRRGPAELRLEIRSRCEETLDGKPIECVSRQSFGDGVEEVVERFRFGPAEIELISEQGGRQRTSQHPLPSGDWLMPGAAERVIRAYHAAKRDHYTVRIFDPAAGVTPPTLTRTRAGEAADVPLPGGKVVRAEPWREESSLAPGVVSMVDLDAEGDVVRARLDILGVELLVLRTDRDTAQAGRGAFEAVSQGMVKPDRPITEPRRLTRAVYRVNAKSGELPDLPSTAGQTVEPSVDRKSVRITVSIDGGPADPGEDLRPYLAATTALSFDDPEVARLVRQAVTDAAAPPAARADSTRRFVHRFLTRKDLETAFGSASEVARSRSGDCTEHSVLLAALLRAQQIPARVAVGVLYVDEFLGSHQVFGYHMWTQARIDGRWVDLDASFPNRFDATHIAFATSALADGGAGGTGLQSLIALIGRVEIAVLETEAK